VVLKLPAAMRAYVGAGPWHSCPVPRQVAVTQWCVHGFSQMRAAGMHAQISEHFDGRNSSQLSRFCVAYV